MEFTWKNKVEKQLLLLFLHIWTVKKETRDRLKFYAVFFFVLPWLFTQWEKKINKRKHKIKPRFWPNIKFVRDYKWKVWYWIIYYFILLDYNILPQSTSDFMVLTIPLSTGIKTKIMCTNRILKSMEKMKYTRDLLKI